MNSFGVDKNDNASFEHMFNIDIEIAKAAVRLEAWLHFVDFCTTNELYVQYAVAELVVG